MSSSLKEEQTRVVELYNLLKKSKNAPLDEVKQILESGKDKPFDPELTFGNLPENLPVCLAARAQRVDILAHLMETYHADVNFNFFMTMVPAVNTMDIIPASKMCRISFQDFIVIACCNNYDVCCKMVTLVTKQETMKNTYSRNILIYLTQSAINYIDVRVLHATLSNIQTLPTDNDGRTSLHHAAMRCGALTDPHAPVIMVLEELAKVSASVNTFDDYGLTALHYACRAGCLAAVRVLIAAGADVNRYWGNDSCTALHLAVAAQNIDLVHELLHAGAKNNTEVLCDYVENERVNISGDPSDVARAAGNFRLARYVADPLRSSLGVLLDSDQGEDGTSAIMFEPTPGEEIDGTCTICMEDTKLIPLGRCHHAFCRNCLAQWFSTSCNGVSRPQCPYSGCNVPVSIYDIRAVAGNEMANHVDQLLLQRSLAEMPDFRWCPRCSDGGFFEGSCNDAECVNCGYKFCTDCQQEAHPGMTCREKCSQMVDLRIGSLHWINQNTKQCPACHVPICKNGGCSHMRCTRCGYEFCWFCLGKYQGIYTFEQRCPCKRVTS